jgi:phage N-6-adenine-methyltransferase
MTSSANPNLLGYVGSKPGAADRDSDAWYTPAPYVEAARKTMGRIDLDPFSNQIANKQIVKAGRFFTEKDNAFKKEWKRRGISDGMRIWMNPPYSKGLCGLAVQRFLQEMRSQDPVAGIMLVNNATDTTWWHAAAEYADAIAYTRGRISFWDAQGKPQSGNTRGQVFFFFSSISEVTVDSFAENFSEFCNIQLPYGK